MPVRCAKLLPVTKLGNGTNLPLLCTNFPLPHFERLHSIASSPNTWGIRRKSSEYHSKVVGRGRRPGHRRVRSVLAVILVIAAGAMRALQLARYEYYSRPSLRRPGGRAFNFDRSTGTHWS